MEVLGAAYDLIVRAQLSRRIVPPLSFDQWHPFILGFYVRCFRENPQGEWALSRYRAGADLIGYFVGLWEDEDCSRDVMMEMKNWLASLYREGDEQLRTCVVTATLEHLFEEEALRNFFADWQDDLVLKEAHTQAMEWVLGGGRTLPLMRAFWKLNAQGSDE